MPLRKKRFTQKKLIIWAIIIALLVLMIISFAPHPEFTETVLYP